jgi:hypothetical protein
MEALRAFPKAHGRREPALLLGNDESLLEGHPAGHAVEL